MKIRFLGTLLIFILLALPLTAAPPAGKENAAWMRAMKSTQIDNESYIDANLIFMFVTNHGNFGRDLAGVFGHDYGTYYPYTDIGSIENGSNISSPLYASGLWIGGVDSVSGEVRVIIAEYSDEYVPGPMQGGTFLPDRPEFRVYKLYAESLANNPNQDYLEYLQYAVAQGAPFETTLTGDTIPKMIGDQMLWAVYNDADPGQHTNNSGETNPLGIEVRQTTFAFTREDALGSIVFIKLQAYNRGSNVLKDVYMSLWADPDLGGAGDDFVGCDTMLSLGFCYNSDNDDQYYQATPPCLGYDFFQGPLIFTGDMADTAKMWDTLWPGYTNMGMVSFNKYINGTDPDNFQETYNYMRGLNRDGSPYIDPTTGLVTKYFLSGDPIAGIGDLDVAPADRRFMQSTGPIEFRPGDSTEILAAIVVGRGGDRLSSIAVMKYYDRFAQSAYDLDFDLPKPPAPPVVTTKELDGKISLRWTDTSEVDPGDYPFEGYTIYQGESPSGPWKRIANYDVVNGYAQILDEVLDPLTGVLETRGVKFGSDNGLKRFFIVEQDYLLGGELKNATEYYFRVEAYSFNPFATPKTLTSANRTPISVTPQAPPAGYDYHSVAGQLDTTVQKISGLSDGVVEVVIVDPTELTGHTYRVVFEDTVGIVIDTIVDVTVTPPETSYVSTDIAWHLDDVTTGERLFEYLVNQSGDYEYPVIDGFMPKVMGPPQPGVKPGFEGDSDEGWRIPSGTRRFTWASADGFHFESFEGALGWAGPGDVFSSANVRVGPERLANVLLVLAQADATGNFNVNDTNVSYAYRYGRGFTSPPARPEFAPFMINTVDGGYRFQDFAKSVPISAWNVDANPPRRLALAYLENNQPYAVLDGKYWPRAHTDFADSEFVANGVSNTSGNGPREWLWVLDADYSETPNPAYQGDMLDDPIPVMYFLTVNRRGNAVFSPGGTGEDQFLIIPAKINTPADTFLFTPKAPTYAASENELDKIKAVPNPFYLYSTYDPSPGFNTLKFHHLPRKCDISIYNIAGDKVRTIKKDDPSAITSWDLLTEKGLPVASGIYIYVVDAPGFGQKIGKIAVFTEAEVLKIY